MKNLPAPMQARISGSGSTLCRLIEFVLLNGTTLYFTDSDRDVLVGSQVYSASEGATVSQVQLVLGASTQSCTVELLLGDSGITTTLIEAGGLDNASFTVKVTDWSLPTLTPIVFYVGFVSKVTYKDRLTASIEGQPLSSRGQPLAVDKYSTNCRADLGDAKCKVNVETLKATGCTVTSVFNAQRFACVYIDGNWNNGLVVFTSGVNEGYSFEVATVLPGQITLKGLMPFTPDAGDTFTLYPGCDKTTTNCSTIYNNILNFQGEPFSISPYTATNKPVAVTPIIQPVPGNTYAAASTTPSKKFVYQFPYVNNK